jgi:hypothetical protein
MRGYSAFFILPSAFPVGLRRAVELILGEMPLKMVAAELGYKDAAHFTHDFKG